MFIMTPLVTVVIPVAPHHEALAANAIASVQRQTVLTAVIPYYDKQSRGAGYARNQGARDTDTPFVSFLDADDTLAPTFIEQCLNIYTKGHYVYTGWYAGSRPVMPDAQHPYKGKGFHLVTTLIPTVAYREVGAFDETLPGHEDADLHFKMMAAGVCGILAPDYLIHYSPHGARGKSFRARSDYETIRKQVFERHGGEQVIMCCGLPDAPGQALPMGEKHEGDVEALTGVRQFPVRIKCALLAWSALKELLKNKTKLEKQNHE